MNAIYHTSFYISATTLKAWGQGLVLILEPTPGLRHFRECFVSMPLKKCLAGISPAYASAFSSVFDIRILG